MRRRVAGRLLAGLGLSYAAAGVLFLTTLSPGGVALGLLFLGGAALLYLGWAVLDELRTMRALLELQAYRDPSYSAAPEEVAP